MFNAINFTGDSNRFGRGVVHKGKGGGAPAPPDPKTTAAAQTQSNVDTAIANSILANTNQYTPYGSLTYNQTGEKTLTNAEGKSYNIPQYSATTTLSPEQQAILNATNRADLGMTNLAADYTSRIQEATKTPFSYEGMPAAPVYDEAYRQKTLSDILARAQPNMEKDRAALEQQLANQGITVGSKPWENSWRDYNTGVNDFRLGADIQSGAEAQRIFGLQGATRDRAIQESLAQRNQPLNEVVALLHGGGGVQMPGFVNTPSAAVSPTDVAGIYNQDYQNRLAIWQAKQAQQQGMMGGLFGLGGSVAGGLARGGLGLGGLFGGAGGSLGSMAGALAISDRRYKRDVMHIGTHHNGLPIYAFRYFDNPTVHIGFMADEVVELHPHAVVDIGGILHVNYDEAVK